MKEQRVSFRLIFTPYAVWMDLNALHAFIANLLTVEYPDIRQDEDGVWKAYGRQGIQYKIIEATVNERYPDGTPLI